MQRRIFNVVQCKASQLQQGGLQLQHLVYSTDLAHTADSGDHLTVCLSWQLFTYVFFRIFFFLRSCISDLIMSVLFTVAG